MARLRIPAAAAGPGIQVLPPGCTESVWKRSFGFRLRGTQLEFDPCVPPGWSCYEITYRHRSATYHIVIENSGGSGRAVRSVSVDGRTVPEGVVELVDDGRQHEVQIVLGS
jgi:cellobiose phosphorylase